LASLSVAVSLTALLLSGVFSMQRKPAAMSERTAQLLPAQQSGAALMVANAIPGSPAMRTEVLHHRQAFPILRGKAECRLGELIPLRKMLIELARHNASGLSARGLTSVIYGKPVVSAGHFLQRWASYQLAENTRPP
jgi:hypothetical protein